MSLPVIAAAPVTLRHVKKAGSAGAVTVLGATFVPQARKGVNGRRGYSTGTYESVMSDEGKGTLTFPNTVGDDGVLHRRRFLCLTDPEYHPGDEWIEVIQDDRTLFVGTPIDWDKRRVTVTLELADALWMLNTQRETAAGFWCHAPRDVCEHYTKAWVPVVSDDFDSGADPARWATVGATNQAGSVRLAPTGSGDAFVVARPTAWATIDLATDRAWRLEARLDRALDSTGGTTGGVSGVNDVHVTLAMVDFATSTPFARLAVGTRSITIEFGSDVQQVNRSSGETKAGASMAIEVRDRWALFYVDGELVFSGELDISSSTPTVPQVAVFGTSGDNTTVDVREILLRRADPYLMRGADRGDYRIPGVLPSGGLRGTYYDESDLRSYGDTTAQYYRRALAPTRQPYARRQDATINFPTSNPLTWQPPTPPNGEYFSARWTGAIYLDLAAADVLLRISQLDNAARLWVGKTMYGDRVLDRWTSPAGAPFTLTTASMRAQLGASVSGWYPIRIDYAQGAAPGGIVLQRSVGGGAYEVVPSTVLSPYGIYEAQVRYDSHAEQLKALALSYGLQYRCEPRSLESGQFPGEVVPRVRVGRDTDKVLTPDESTDVGVQGSASEVIDTLLADASGLGDQANAAQLTSEAINYAGVDAGHMMILGSYESLADITDPVLLQTRLTSMLGLRLTAWEEVAARPRGHRELRDTFPLTGQIAAFAWQPGDALRIQDDAIDLNDDTPRQIIATSWTFNPDGLGAPSVRFRRSRRSQQDALRALVRATLLPQRNYQGQLVTVNGSWSNTDAGYTRVALPRNLDDVVRCELVIGIKSDASTWTIRDMAATTLATFNTTGRINLLAALKRRTDNTLGGVGQMFIVQGAGGTGTAEYALELLVRA